MGRVVGLDQVMDSHMEEIFLQAVARILHVTKIADLTIMGQV